MIRLTVLITLCITLTGCSTKFVYNNIDWFIVEYVEGYVELSNAQEELVSQKIARLSQWHRQEELPLYIEHLDELMVLEPQSFTLEGLKEQQQRFQQHSRRLIEQLSPEIFSIAQQLDDEQVDEFMDSIRVKHMEFREKYQDLSDPEIREIYHQRIEDNMETWIGALTDQQESLVEQWSNEVYVTTHEWIGYQTRMRIEVVDLLDHRMAAPRFHSKFRQIMLNPDSYYDESLESKVSHNRDLIDSYLIQIINSMTEEQTQHYREELGEWRELAQSICS